MHRIHNPHAETLKQQSGQFIENACFAVTLEQLLQMETVAGAMVQSGQTYQPHWSPLTWWQPWLHPILTILAVVAGASPRLFSSYIYTPSAAKSPIHVVAAVLLC